MISFKKNYYIREYNNNKSQINKLLQIFYENTNYYKLHSK